MLYQRAIAPDFAEALSSRGALRGLLPLTKRLAGEDPYAVDIQFCGRHGLWLYHGQQVIAFIRYDATNGEINVRFASQNCPGIAEVCDRHSKNVAPGRGAGALIL
jgi:hypothetical protein